MKSGNLNFLETCGPVKACNGFALYMLLIVSIQILVPIPVPRGLRRRSAAARLLRLWVRIPPWAWMFVCCECCVGQVEVSATSWSLVQRSPTDCDASLRVIQKPQKWGGHGPRWAAAPRGGEGVGIQILVAKYMKKSAHYCIWYSQTSIMILKIIGLHFCLNTIKSGFVYVV